MKSRTTIIRSVILAVALPTVAVAAGMLPGCATTQAMHASPGVPASEGTVTVSEGDNGNTDVVVSVEHLALAWNVSPEATVYVVWLQAPDGAWQSLGAMTLDDNLDGTLVTMTPHRRFLVMVTPELSAQVAQPTNAAVLTADVNLDAPAI